MPRFLTRTHTEHITSDHTEYTVHTEGAVDPFNEEVIIENIGPVPIDNPIITVNGKYNWSSVEAMAREITDGCVSDEEKAMAIFNWVRTNGDHQYSGDIQALNPVLLFNVFGYGICAYFASAQTGIARAAGLQARVWEIYRHTVAEIYYDDAWHMLDPDMQLFFLNPDNRTVASVEELEKDLEFYTRTEAYQRTFEDAYGRIRHEHQSKHDTYRYDIKHPRFVQHDYDPHIYNGWKMDYTLGVDETIVRRWQGNGKHNDYRNQSRFKLNEEEPHKTWPPVHYGNGYVRYKPRDMERLIAHCACENLIVSDGDLAVDKPQDSRNGARSTLRYRRPLPYLIVGGRLRGEAFREGDAAYDLVSITGYKQTNATERQRLHEQSHPGRRRFDIDLDDFLYPEPDHYAYEFGVRFNLSAYAGHETSVRTGISDLEVLTEFQVQPRSLPRLKLGDNALRLLHLPDSDADIQAEITHTWTERHGFKVTAPPTPVSPSDSYAMTDEGITFHWRPPKINASSYRFQLSFHHLCAFPLSPNFDIDLKCDTPEFHVDASWFNKGTTYYWRVQAKSEHDLWGEWSRIQEFTIE